jgi:hypothetical protein
MKINEIITEGLFDTLKTAGQAANKNIARSFNRGATRAKVMGRNVAQTYQQTMQDRQQRFDQQAAQQFPQPQKISRFGKEYSPQQQLKAKNAGTFMGDVAKTIAGASPGASYFTKATPTATNIPNGEMVDTELGKFKKTAQGWATETNTPVTDPNIVSRLNSIYQKEHPQPAPQAPQVDTSKIQPAPRAGQPTPDEQAKLQAKLQAALQNQQGQQ